MEQEREELRLLLLNSFNRLDKIDTLSDLYQVEIFLKKYLADYVELNKKRIQSKIKIWEGS